jgi:aminopeptidase I
MDLRNNKHLKETFTILNIEGNDIISTDDEDTTDSTTTSTDTEVPAIQDELEYRYKFPTVNSTTATATDYFDSYYEGYADQFMKFIDGNPTTYHVVDHMKCLLLNNGFLYLDAKHDLTVSKPGFYFTTRDDSSVVAFIVGGKWKPGNGSSVVGTHIDALTVKINPGTSLLKNKDGFELLQVQPYSGSLNQLWLNRDLALAGAILVREDGKIKRKLINSSPYPIGFIPVLAEHFGIEKSYNKQTEMVPIIGTSNDLEASPSEKSSPLFGKHPLSLLRYVSQLAQVDLKQIIQLDVELVDNQKASRGGLENEFIYSTSLDDRLCAFDSIYGLLEFSKKFYQLEDINSYDGLVGCYMANNEEIGSETRTGAQSGFLRQVMVSLVTSFGGKNVAEETSQLFTNSVILSSDVTHAFNPNFSDIYLENHHPLPNTGPVIKIDTNMHVLSDSLGHEFLQQIVDTYLPDLKLQLFHIRNDSRSGGTIGPILGNGRQNINGAKIVVDVGMPILSMHSIRSICGYKDIGMGVRFFKNVFSHWSSVIGEIEGRKGKK